MADDTATTLARVDAACAGLADPLTADAVRSAIHGVALALSTPPDPSEVVTVDPDTGEATTPAPVTDDGEVLTPRDETTDSIDPNTGTLTTDAVAKRQKLADDQAARDAKAAEVEADKTELAADEADLAGLEQAVSDDQAAIDAEAATPDPVADPAA